MKARLFIYSLILIFLSAGLSAGAQEKRSVSGIVTSFRIYPLNGVKIVASKSGEIAYSDSSGRFEIVILNRDVLSASASGFKTRKARTGKNNIYQVDLLFIENPANFNNAVNNRHISEDALRQAIFDAESKNKRDYSIYTTIYELIENEIYNVKVSGTTIYNKKIRSFDATPQVLYVVDDRIVPDISFVAPNYVKSIEFIDDVGATLYGVQGANGVIKITLK